MTPEPPANDRLERALAALKATPGPPEPPAEAVARLRRAIAEKRPVPSATPSPRARPRERSPWLSLALTLAVMVSAGWGIGFHRRWLSEVAGRQTFPDGSRIVFYTDGRVVGLADRPVEGRNLR